MQNSSAQPVGAAILGALTLSDSAMSTSNAILATQVAAGGVTLQTAKVTLPTLGNMRREARYVKISASGVNGGTKSWVLRELRFRTAEPTTGATRFRGVQRMKVKRVTIQEPIYASTSQTTPGAVRRRAYVIPDEVDPWYPDPVPPPPPAPDPAPPPPPPPAPPGSTPTLPANVPVVFQHGFKDFASVWTPMRDTLRPKLSIVDIAFNLNVEGELTDAGNALQQNTRSFFNAPTVFIGHSAGGLLSRYVGNIDPALVAGVVTVGTPHQGALIAERGQVAAAVFGSLVSETFATLPCQVGILEPGGPSCGVLDVLSTGLGAYLGSRVGNNVTGPARDLRPNSAFVANRNATAESYPRVGITHRINTRWGGAQMLSEVRQIPLDWNDSAAEDGARKASLVYQSAWFVFVSSTVQMWMLATQENSQSGLQIDAYCGPLYSGSSSCGGGYQSPWDRYANGEVWWRYLQFWQTLSFDTILLMEASDLLWKAATANFAPSDGFISAESQEYPFTENSPTAPVNVETVRDAPQYGSRPAHNGEPRSKQVEVRLFESLVERIGVRLRQ
jgi:pimeloyl-ACP methyl ester carboxylesterase